MRGIYNLNILIEHPLQDHDTLMLLTIMRMVKPSGKGTLGSEEGLRLSFLSTSGSLYVQGAVVC